MRITEDRIVINEAISINWESVIGLKALGHKLFFELEGDLKLEIGGLSNDQIDEIFRAYSHHLLVHSAT